MNTNSTLGVDCGDVIFYTWGGSVPGSLANLREIAASGRFKEIHIVSKAHPMTRAIFLARLRMLNFWHYTGIPRENLHFCMHYEDKSAICTDLGITHFVDDRLRVLDALKTVPNRYALREGGPRPKEIHEYPAAYESVTRVNSWEELRQLL